MIVRSTSQYSNAYLLALLNSRLLSFWFDITYDKFQRGIFPQFKINELAEFPIRALDLSGATDRKLHNELSSKAATLIAAKKDLVSATTDKQKNFYVGKISSLDRQIDLLVYSLYGLKAFDIESLERTEETHVESLPTAME